MKENYQTIINNGLWHQNQALVVLLGLCPLLAVSNTLVNSIGLSVATTLTLVMSNGLIASVRYYLMAEIRLPLFVLLIAGIVTLIELLLQTWFYELYKILGIFIPLIVTNCAIMGRAEMFASKNPVLPSLLDGLAMGLGFSLALMVLGALRELLSTGVIFSQAELLFGIQAGSWAITIFTETYHGILLVALPAGAFICLGLLIALKNAITLHKEER